MHVVAPARHQHGDADAFHKVPGPFDLITVRHRSPPFVAPWRLPAQCLFDPVVPQSALELLRTCGVDAR
jgi:hypothetical protein